MTPARRLLHYFSRYRTPLIVGGLCVIGSAFFSLVKPMIVGGAVNELAAIMSRSTLIRYALYYVAAAIGQGIFLFLQRRIIIGVSRKMEFDMRGDFYDHLQLLSLRFYQGQRTGDLMSRATNDLSSVRMLIGPAVMHSFSSILVVIGAFIMMLRIDTTLALACLAIVPIVAWLVKYFGDEIHDRFRLVQDYFGDISARVQENLAGVRVVRAFTREDHEIERFKAMNRQYVDRNRSLIRMTAVFYPLLHAVSGLMFIIVFYIGSRKMVAGTMAIGDFVAFQFYLGRMIWPLIALGWVMNLFQRGMASMKRLNEIWSVSPEAVVEEGVKPPESGPARSTDAHLELRNLTFRYGRHDVLRRVSLTVRRGETVGIVGRTGSGKSTLLGLLARLHEPPPNSIFLDGRPIELLSLAESRARIAMVPQETFLFSETLAENIRFGRSEAKLEEIQRVASLAGLDDDLAGFPSGIETMVGERGITLSGGQKQRTAIARAIIRDPEILLLDDSLSAVDTATEERILRSLKQLRRGRTVLVVSHRVSSVKDAGQIVVLDQGEIVERGTHEELLQLDGYYADLYRRQTLEEEIQEIA